MILRVVLVSIVMLLAVGGGGSLSAQTDREKQLADFIATTLRRHPGLDSNKPTLLFVTSMLECPGCGALAINTATSLIQKRKLDVNMIVVVKVPDPRDFGNGQKKYTIKVVVADDGTITDTILEAKLKPELIVVSRTGRIIGRYADIQRRHISLDSLESQVKSVSMEGAAVRDGVDIVEDGTPLNIVRSAVLLPRKSHLYILDVSSNRVQVSDVRTGKILYVLLPDSGIKYLFRRDPSDPKWLSMESRGYNVAQFMYLVPDTVENVVFALASVVSGYHVTREPVVVKGKQDTLATTHWRKRDVVAVIKDGRIIRVTPLPDEMRFTFVDICRLDDGGFIGSGLDRTYKQTLSTEELDKLRLLQQHSAQKNAETAFLTIGSIRNVFNVKRFDPKYFGWTSLTKNGQLCYINQDNRVFFYWDFKSGDSMIKAIAPAGSLKQAFDCSARYYEESGDSSRKFECPLLIAGTASGDKDLYLLLRGGQRETAGHIVVQRYDFAGNFLGERDIKFDDDSIAALHVVGRVGNVVQLLVKWQKRRWRFEQVKLS